ncbi:hypothetical protein QE429_002548 [Bacillus sp. SORGH_AS 510]|nr:hypothetical protein [Bacillus sp. SORGH_AS_0510]
MKHKSAEPGVGLHAFGSNSFLRHEGLFFADQIGPPFFLQQMFVNPFPE